MDRFYIVIFKLLLYTEIWAHFPRPPEDENSKLRGQNQNVSNYT